MLKPVKLKWKCGSWCHVFMSFSSQDFWLINKNKNGSLKTDLSRDILFQFSQSNSYNLLEEYDHKVWCEISFHKLVFYTIAFVFMMSQRSGDEKHKHVVSNCKWCLKPEGPIGRIYTADVQLCPTYKMVSWTPKRHIFWILSIIKIKYGQILVACITSISNVF